MTQPQPPPPSPQVQLAASPQGMKLTPPIGRPTNPLHRKIAIFTLNRNFPHGQNALPFTGIKEGYFLSYINIFK